MDENQSSLRLLPLLKSGANPLTKSSSNQSLFAWAANRTPLFYTTMLSAIASQTQFHLTAADYTNGLREYISNTEHADVGIIIHFLRLGADPEVKSDSGHGLFVLPNCKHWGFQGDQQLFDYIHTNKRMSVSYYTNTLFEYMFSKHSKTMTYGVIHLLLQAGAKTHRKTEEGEETIDFTDLLKSHLEVNERANPTQILEILRLGADPNVKSESGRCLLALDQLKGWKAKAYQKLLSFLCHQKKMPERYFTNALFENLEFRICEQFGIIQLFLLFGAKPYIEREGKRITVFDAAAGGRLNAEGCKMIFDILQKAGHSLYSLYVVPTSIEATKAPDVYVSSLKKIISSGKLSRQQLNAEMKSYLDKNSEPDERVMKLFDMEMLRLAREETSVHSSASTWSGSLLSFFYSSPELPQTKYSDENSEVVKMKMD